MIIARFALVASAHSTQMFCVFAGRVQPRELTHSRVTRMKELRMTHELMSTADSADETAGARPAVDLSVHMPVLLVGLRWLFDTEQPAGAVQSPGGDGLPSVGGRAFRFVPSDRSGHAAVGIAVISSVAGDVIDGHEVAGFIDLLESAGEEIVAVEVIAAGSYCTMRLAREAHPSLRSAVSHYRVQHLLRANASPFGPVDNTEAVAAVSATDLHRQVLNGKANVRTSKPIVYWVDLIDSPATTFTTITQPEPHLATR